VKLKNGKRGKKEIRQARRKKQKKTRTETKRNGGNRSVVKCQRGKKGKENQMKENDIECKGEQKSK
jgi:hypothetical protein